MAKKVKANNRYEDISVWESPLSEKDAKGGQIMNRLRRYFWQDLDDPKRRGVKFILQNIYVKADGKEIRKDYFRVPDDPEVLDALAGMFAQGKAEAGKTYVSPVSDKKVTKAKKASK